jgi:5-methyltetrahydrofolate--homocysteine methyltransferase
MLFRQPKGLEKLLKDKSWVLADGATGTNLFNLGLSSGDAPELWNKTARNKIKALYRGSVDAGSDLFLTNSFGANRSRLKLHGAEKHATELSRVSAEIGREIADAYNNTVIVAGCIGPTGELMEPMGNLSYSIAVEIFHEQAEGLKAGGADLAWIETISSADEFLAAAEGVHLADMQWCGTMSFDTAGRTMMGLTAPELVKLINKIPNQPMAFGANCGVGASDLLRTILSFSKTNTSMPIIAKGNAGIPKYHEGTIIYDGTPELMAQYATLARDCGATIIGGCCGTTPDHLRAMRTRLETHEPKDPPSLKKIQFTLGTFSSESDGTDGNAPTRKRRSQRHKIS